MTLKPGIHDGIPAYAYHADPCDTPSLSSSIARILIGKSPAHARAAHPKLNVPELAPDREAKFEIGTAAHALFLEGADVIAVYAGDSWRKNEAKAFRDEQHELGRIPLLVGQAGHVRSMVAEAHAQIERHRAKPALFACGKPEQTIVWEDDHGVMCRARLDWLRDDYTAIDDLKTSSRTAEPGQWSRASLFPMGYALQARFYQRGVRLLTSVEPVFRFIVVETEPPYAMSVVALSPQAEAIADRMIEWSLASWATCLENDFWPAYTREVAYADAPTWVEMDWLEREAQAA